ncbi:hypothetical protein QR676_21410 [Vibrio sp. TMPB1044]|uniref:hypothetical protein n=1 Tax=Vibrio sp. TMPB1044 TaxID=3051822 RepID=UPI00255BD073|nr:hypothetical protein [Vibrio sp. TMPB1044]MDL5029788.1 hypothetical protein [Vibrio sp. TMPB1044]MDN5209916.1 hypothetical protein [Vibrio sp. TMPB1044]
MSILTTKLGNLKPGYLPRFKDFFEQVTQFGGGAEGDKYLKAKSFSNAYELYIYAFFIGLYKDKKIDITQDDKTQGFWEMKNWKPKELTDSVITCAIAVSDFNMNAIEDGDDKFVTEQIKLLKTEIESYANGGLSYIKSEIDQDPELLEDDMYFIRLLQEK